MKNILIIGCGLLGSSILRRISKKKITKKVFVYEKSKINIKKIKKLKLPIIIVKKLDDVVSKSDLIILCTPMSQYKDIILKINKFLGPKNLITDIGSTKLQSLKIIRANLKKNVSALIAMLGRRGCGGGSAGARHQQHRFPASAADRG